MKTFNVSSSNGSLTANSETGEVIECVLNCESDEIENIKKFDVQEWLKTYKVKLHSSIDILDIGYWTKDGSYQSAEKDWRKEVQISLNEDKRAKLIFILNI